MSEPTYLTLKPALTFKATIELPRPVGSGPLSTGSQKLYINLKTLTLTSSADFTPAINATTLYAGGDWATTDPSGKYARLDVRAVVQTKEEKYLNIEYAGIVTMTPEIQKVLGGAKDAKTTRWGDLVVTPRFEGVTELEGKMWVASGRFIVDDDGTRTVEYRISEVVGCDG